VQQVVAREGQHAKPGLAPIHQAGLPRRAGMPAASVASAWWWRL
jgi:hypothetical protein